MSKPSLLASFPRKFGECPISLAESAPGLYWLRKNLPPLEMFLHGCEVFDFHIYQVGVMNKILPSLEMGV